MAKRLPIVLMVIGGALIFVGITNPLNINLVLCVDYHIGTCRAFYGNLRKKACRS